MPEENEIVEAEFSTLEEEAQDEQMEIDLENVEDQIIQADIDQSAQNNVGLPVDPNVIVFKEPSPVADSVSDAIRTFEQELSGFDRAVEKTAPVRELILDKLHQTVKGIQSIDLSDGEDVNNKLSVLNVALKAASDIESSHVRRIATKRAYENQRNDDAMSESIVDIFRQLAEERSGKGGDHIPSEADELKLLDDKFAKDGEPILETEMRTDPDDIS